MGDDARLQAAKAFAIDDVYIVEAKAWANRVFQAPEGVPLGVQFRIDPQVQIQSVEMQDAASGAKAHRVQYFVGAALRILKPGIDANSLDVPQEDLVAELSATFAVKYLDQSGQAPTQEMTIAFANDAIHHMWPYWREFAQTTTMRLRVPTVMIPTKILNPPGAPKQ